MSESQGGAGRREVAYRLFATEFDDADFSYSESDEERAPNYVVTPTGARVNRLFVVGVLTEIETVSEDYLRARVVDPTGPFVVYAGQYQPEALAFLERAEPPLFVAVTGKARTYQPDDSDRVFTSVRPETISEVDAETRDRWVVGTAERTVERVTRMAEAKQSGLAGDDLRTALQAHGVDDGLAAGIPLALDHYGTTGDYLAAVRDVALDSARVVSGEIDEAGSMTVAPDDGDDGPVAPLVERPIDVDAIETDPEAEAAEPDAAAGETGQADAADDTGSAVGTAEASEPAGTETAGASETADAAAEAESGEATTTMDGRTSDGTDAPADEGEQDRPAATADAPGDGAGATTSSGEAQASETGEISSVDAGTDAEAQTSGTTDAGDESDDLEDFEPEFDLDDDEREEIEAEYGTEFQSGTEVEEPGEAGIETPDAEADATGEDADEVADGTAEAPAAEPSTDIDPVEETEPASDEATGDGEEDERTTEPESEPEATAEGDADDEGGVAEAEPAEDTAEQSSVSPPSSSTREDIDLEDVDLEDAVMDAMTDLDEGNGASRDEVLAAVVDRTGADPGDVEDAIQDALMGGRCYEPDDETLKPI